MIEYIKVGEDSRRKTEEALLSNGHNVFLQWEKVIKEKSNQKIPATCGICDTTVVKSVESLKKGLHSCKTCVVNNYTSLLAEQGFLYLSHQRHTAKIRCNTCKYNTEVAVQSIVKGCKPKCETCLQEKYRKLADELGFNFIRKSNTEAKSGTFIVLQCREDSTEVVVPSGDLINGYVRCQTCKELNWSTLLAKKGCIFNHSEYKQHGTVKKTRVTYQNSVGEVFEVTAGDLTKGRFATTKENHWNTAHSTYLMLTEYEGKLYCKIGTAQVPQQRLKDLKLKGKSIVFTLENFPERFSANTLESQLHKEFETLQIARAIAEEFTMGFSSVLYKNANERVQVKHGTTEWYTSEVYTILKQRYNLEENNNNGTDINTADTVTNSR
jgi:hypothetical protein